MKWFVYGCFLFVFAVAGFCVNTVCFVWFGLVYVCCGFAFELILICFRSLCILVSIVFRFTLDFVWN